MFNIIKQQFNFKDTEKEYIDCMVKGGYMKPKEKPQHREKSDD